MIWIVGMADKGSPSNNGNKKKSGQQNGMSLFGKPDVLFLLQVIKLVMMRMNMILIVKLICKVLET